MFVNKRKESVPLLEVFEICSWVTVKSSLKNKNFFKKNYTIKLIENFGQYV